jgi:2-polyprenyl-3-methyl-5-hydroxy-6-metoxy-1,4-benzoquinol methylase
VPNTERDPETHAQHEEEIINQYGDTYAQHKSWDDEQFGVLTVREEADLTAIIRKAKVSIPPQSRVLEIGFGNGGFLVYGRKRKWEMYGTEMNELLLKRARRNGFDVIHADNLDSFASDYFDLVVAIDVLEHVPGHRIQGFLTDVKRISKDKAVFIARFPNGDSPFGRFSQHGDPTHTTTIGSHKARYLAEEAGMEIIYIGGEAQPILSGLSHFLYRLVANPVKKLLNLILNFLFCPGARRALCSINLVTILRIRKPSTH